ncbi:TIGR04104 family putative zinc finger protein [Alkalicoccus urumqiensis]|uniref:CXXC-20-CXXC protein n=1 Tax=Alkalicoccus urumqiensis TaxID=1548213 RepID=A0A2P6MFH6_ALKUR|nr:TIGR04104 family putative zinc finger protein [Alkalicoccus urumqiensis]PRO65045.1 hypothetical protein C6I21_11395 [Alkalicoccus urumqiensis]
MPTCPYCCTTWSYKETWKAMWSFHKLKCPHCGEKSFHSRKSRLKTGSASMYGALFPLVSIIPVTLLLTGPLFFLGVVVVFAYMPKLIELSREEEPLI